MYRSIKIENSFTRLIESWEVGDALSNLTLLEIQLIEGEETIEDVVLQVKETYLLLNNLLSELFTAIELFKSKNGLDNDSISSGFYYNYVFCKALKIQLELDRMKFTTDVEKLSIALDYTIPEYLADLFMPLHTATSFLYVHLYALRKAYYEMVSN